MDVFCRSFILQYCQAPPRPIWVASGELQPLNILVFVKGVLLQFSVAPGRATDAYFQSGLVYACLIAFRLYIW